MGSARAICRPVIPPLFPLPFCCSFSFFVSRSFSIHTYRPLLCRSRKPTDILPVHEAWLNGQQSKKFAGFDFLWLGSSTIHISAITTSCLGSPCTRLERQYFFSLFRVSNPFTVHQFLSSPRTLYENTSGGRNFERYKFRNC